MLRRKTGRTLVFRLVATALSTSLIALVALNVQQSEEFSSDVLLQGGLHPDGTSLQMLDQVTCVQCIHYTCVNTPSFSQSSKHVCGGGCVSLCVYWSHMCVCVCVCVCLCSCGWDGVRDYVASLQMLDQLCVRACAYACAWAYFCVIVCAFVPVMRVEMTTGDQNGGILAIGHIVWRRPDATRPRGGVWYLRSRVLPTGGRGRGNQST